MDSHGTYQLARLTHAKGQSSKRSGRVLIQCWVLFVFFAGLASLARPALLAQVVRTSAGSVEFLGLEKWTPAQIQQRLGYTSADQLHYCAADLKKLGFPEVAVVGYAEHGHRNAVVTVVEPQHAAEVVYKSRPSQHLSLPAEWGDIKAIPKEPGFLEGGILDYGRTLPGALTDRPWLADGAPHAWWPTMRSHLSESDFHSALQILQQSDDPDSRAIAGIMLMNFASADAAWHSLVSGLRDPNSLVQAACLQALNSLATYHPRKVDWAPATSDLVKLLHGTDLFAFQFVLKALTVTKIDPALAGPLLRHGGARLVISHLRAEHDEQRDLAHGFLVQMDGRDLGSDPAPWESWVARL
jgi:hypothetical protein